jgi:hypothetical protein
MKPRQKPMARGSGLARSSLARGTGLRPVSVKTAVKPKVPAQRIETGFPSRVRLAIRARAGDGNIDDACCECCAIWLGRYGGQIQHRTARGMGGCRDSVINGTAGGVLLCGTSVTGCHGLAERRDEEMLRDGFWLEHGVGPDYDPRFAPIRWHARADAGELRWLGEDGRYLDTDPYEVAT